MTDDHEPRFQIAALEELRGEFLRVAHDDPGSGRRRVPPAVAAVLGLSLLAGGGVAGIIAAQNGDMAHDATASNNALSRSGDTSAGKAPQPVGLAAYEPMFGSVKELTAKSDIVAIGTVQDVTRGKIVIPDSETPTRELDVTLSIEDLPKGSVSTNTVTVATLETAFTGPPGGDFTDWRRPGQRVAAFLESDQGKPPAYQPVNYTQAIYIVRDDALEAVDREAPGSLSERIAAMSLPEFRRSVESDAGRE